MTRSTNSWHSVNLNSSRASNNSKDSNSSHNRDFNNSSHNRDFSNSRDSNNSKDSNSSHSKVSPDRELLPLSSRQLPSRPRCPPDQRCFSM